MRRRTVVVGLPATLIVRSQATAQTATAGARAVSAARESLIGFRREFLREAARIPLPLVQDPLRTAPDLMAVDLRIRTDLQASLGELKPDELRALVLPPFAEAAAQVSRFGSLAPSKDEIVPVRFQPVIRLGSLRRLIEKILAAIYWALDLADLIERLLQFTERHPKLMALASQIEQAARAKDLEATVRAVDAFLDELMASSFGEFFGYIPELFHRRLIRRITTRFIPIIGPTLLAIEVANAFLNVADEIFDT
jgi:hypothetical protein